MPLRRSSPFVSKLYSCIYCTSHIFRYNFILVSTRKMIDIRTICLASRTRALPKGSICPIFFCHLPLDLHYLVWRSLREEVLVDRQVVIILPLQINQLSLFFLMRGTTVLSSVRYGILATHKSWDQSLTVGVTYKRNSLIFSSESCIRNKSIYLLCIEKYRPTAQGLHVPSW